MDGEPITRARFLASAIASAMTPAGGAEHLELRLRDDRLYVAAAGLDLLSGPLLDKLKNGASVPFDFHLWLWVHSRSELHRRAFERFVVSYDLWEERFAVTGLSNPRPSASNLTAKAVPAWCLGQISLHPVELPAAAPVWVRLDVRATERKENGGLLDESGLSLNYLIELLSRPSRREPNRWTVETGPVRFSSIPR